MSRSRSARRARSPNAPPLDEPWGWFSREMLESEAWRAMPLAARHVVERVWLEHMHHAGTANGELVVTYDDFIAYGLSSRRATGAAIRVAQALGFLDVTTKGHRSYGGVRRPSRYGLAWLPTRGQPASNRWRKIETRVDALTIVAAAREKPATDAAPLLMRRCAIA